MVVVAVVFSEDFLLEKNVWLRWYRLLSPQLDRPEYMHSTLLYRTYMLARE